MRREIALDAWRGLMLIVMAGYHFGGPLAALCRQTLGYVSAAEGFVLLSGLMCGLVYSRYGEVSFSLLRQRAWHRAWTIYRHHVSVLLLLLGFVVALGQLPGEPDRYFLDGDLVLFVENPDAAALAVLTLAYLPTNIGILGLYVVYMTSAPVILTAFQRGHAPLLFAASGACWLFAQFGGSTWLGGQLPWRDALELGDFDVFAWQILFVTGCYLGWRRAAGWEPRSPPAPVVAAAAAIAVVLFLARHAIIEIPALSVRSAVDVPSLAWLRLANTAIVAFVIFALARRHAVTLRHRWLALLGSHSLPVFSYHALLIYLLVPVRWRIAAWGPAAEIAASLLFLASLWLPALAHDWYRARDRAYKVATARP